MLKHKITAAEFAAMSDEVKGHYIKDVQGDGYSLSTSGESITEATLRQQLGAAGVRAADAETRAATAEAQIATAAATAEAQHTATIEKLTEQVATMRTNEIAVARKAVVDSVANNFTTPELFADAVAVRVKATHNEDGTLTVTCHDAKGAVITQDALIKEYCSNAAYSGMLKPKTTVTTPTQPQSLSNPHQQQQQASGDSVQYDSNGKATYINHATASVADIAAAISTHVSEPQQ